MMDTHLNLQTLHLEIDWLEAVIDQVIKSYLLQEGHENHWRDIALPMLPDTGGPYADMVSGLDVFSRLALALTMAPHLRPAALDIFFGRNQLYDRGFTEFGGTISKGHSGFLPTGQTFCFLATATDPEWRAEVLQVLDKAHPLIKNGVITLEESEPGLPRLNGTLSLDSSWFEYFITGRRLQAEHSSSFPAQAISTAMNWEDVVLDDIVQAQVAEITTWLEHSSTLMQDWGLAKFIKPGYRVLFYGPPGTGKTLTATLIGKTTGREVYKVDLSMIVSKYIGDTEKNLSKLFDAAQHRDWILFFDEADALFGKRTAASSSNDHHSNQQIAYLLQRIEDFPGVVILASNLKANMDEAFSRRFQGMIHFAMPSAAERYRIWQQSFSGTCTLHPGIDLYKIAEQYELAGGAIINVLRRCALSAIRRNDTVVNMDELQEGIRMELKKGNKTMKLL